jgi:hypothetical protein
MKTHVVDFPTPTLAALIPTLRSEAHQLRMLLEQRSAEGAIAFGGYTHIGILREVAALLDEAGPALALFLAYPTRRLHDGILRQLCDASANVDWLASNPLAGPDQDTISEYTAHCDAIRSGIQEWRLSVDLQSAAWNLEYQVRETLH